MSRPEPPPPVAEDDATPSKTRRKHAMHALQDMGEVLVALDNKRLAELDLPERLVDALVAVRSIRAHEGRRRQMQYIGKLMRDVDAAAIEAALARWAAGAPTDHLRFAAVERWREEILADDAALARFAAEFPTANAATLGSLVNAARAERTRTGPPHRYRELFRTLKAVVDAADKATASDPAPPAE